MIDLITTFNNKLFNEYSKNLLDTFIEKSDDSLRLNVFYEGDFEEIKNNYISYGDKIRFYEFKSKDWNVFYNKFGHLAEANGYNVRYDKLKNSLIADGPSYKWQAVKFLNADNSRDWLAFQPCQTDFFKNLIFLFRNTA